MIELSAIQKKQNTEHQERYPSKKTTISRFRRPLEKDETRYRESEGDHRNIWQKTDHKFSDIIARKKERKEQYKNNDEDKRYHTNETK